MLGRLLSQNAFSSDMGQLMPEREVLLDRARQYMAQNGSALGRWLTHIRHEAILGRSRQ